MYEPVLQHLRELDSPGLLRDFRGGSVAVAGARAGAAAAQPAGQLPTGGEGGDVVGCGVRVPVDAVAAVHGGVVSQGAVQQTERPGVDEPVQPGQVTQALQGVGPRLGATGPQPAADSRQHDKRVVVVQGERDQGRPGVSLVPVVRGVEEARVVAGGQAAARQPVQDLRHTVDDRTTGFVNRWLTAGARQPMVDA